MDIIINKLKETNKYDNWTLEEKKRLLELYLIISKKESSIFDLIYSYHGCDTWEDIFRDYDKNYIKDKKYGVKIAIKEINDRIKNEKNENNENKVNGPFVCKKCNKEHNSWQELFFHIQTEKER